MIHSFLLIGQSNMAGRGYLRDVGQIYDEQIKVLVNGRWQTMTEPINFDRPTAGIGLAASFAATWRMENQEEQIGLIPCADGGTSLDDWNIGGALFENAIFQAKVAQRTSKLSGLLWHQGENDSFAGRSETYYDTLSNIVEALRRELEAPEIPFIAGELGHFLRDGRYGKYFTEYNQVNQAIQRYTHTKPNAYFVSASELTSNDDGLHFNAISQRIFGVRYFKAYSQKEDVLLPLPEERQMVKVLEGRPLSRNERIALLEISFSSGKISLNDFENQLADLNN
jgi:hypothetical protein